MVTIFIPIYNVENILFICVGGMMNQTYTEWEFIWR